MWLINHQLIGSEESYYLHLWPTHLQIHKFPFYFDTFPGHHVIVNQPFLAIETPN